MGVATCGVLRNPILVPLTISLSWSMELWEGRPFSISSPTVQFLLFRSNKVESLPLLSSVCLDV